MEMSELLWWSRERSPMPKCKGATGGGAAVPVSLFGLTGIDSGDKPRFSIAVGIRTARRLASGYRFRSTRAA